MVAIRPLKWLRRNAVTLAMVSMIGLLTVAVVLLFGRLQRGLLALWQNQVLTEGLWGFTLLGLVLVFVLIGFRGASVEYRTLLASSVLLILGTLITKMLDGGQFGDPTLGRLGWSDSLNRMWLHGFTIFVVTAVVGILQRRKSVI